MEKISEFFKNIFLLLCIYFWGCISVNGQWTQLNSGTGAWLENIDCPTTDICYTVGGSTVLKTTDGGNTWNMFNNGLPNGAYVALDCINPDTCFTDNGTTNELYKTTDGGNTWNIKMALGNAQVKIFMVNDSIGYTASGGGGKYFKTTDGGETWVWKSIFITGGINYAIYFITNDIGFFGTFSNEIVKTTNGGDNWSFSLTGACSFYDIDFPTDSIGYAVGWGGCIYKTTDQGSTWDILNSGIGNGLNSIDCVNKDTCYAVGVAGAVIKTMDGGDTWEWDTVGVPKKNLNAVFFPTKDIGYIVGVEGYIFKKDISVGIKNEKATFPKLFIAPNPFKKQTTIYYSSEKKYDNLVFELYDLVGKKQLVLNISQGENTLKRNKLPSGIYFYIIKDNQYAFKTGKVIIN